MLLQINPVQVFLEGYEDKLIHLEDFLTYKDKKIDFEIRKLKNNPWFLQKYGQEAFVQKLEELKKQKNKSLLFRDVSGRLYTYSGLLPDLLRIFSDEVKVSYPYPDKKIVPTLNGYVLRDYQKEAVEKLMKVKHGSISIATGLGKSLVIFDLLKQHGLKSLVICPSVSIANQLYEGAKHHFGKKYVGKYYSGKKEADKLFVIGVDKSIANIEEGTQDWELISKSQLIAVDESHNTPVVTQAKICFGITKDAPYRYFVSATQMRNDGSDLLLNAIIGPIVFEMSAKDGIDRGYLAKPIFRMIETTSDIQYESFDTNKVTRKHLLYNSNVIRIAADITNHSVSELKRPTLILIEEVEQFADLLPLLRHPVKFAHGPLTKENSKNVPKEFHKVDNTELVSQFNQGKFPILVGTSCVSTGTDFKSVQALIYLQGDKSEIKIRQAIGRSTRLVEGKMDCLIIDFDIINNPTMHRHAEARAKIYNSVYPGLEYVRY